MLNLLLDFISCLKAGELKVSTAEALDCSRHLEIIDYLDEEMFRTTLKCNFVKTHRDSRKFDRLYDLFFHGLPDESDKSNPFDEMRDVLSHLKEDAGEKEKTIVDFVSGNPLPYLEVLKRMKENEPPSFMRFNFGPLANRLEILLMLNRVRDLALNSAYQRGQDEYADLINSRIERAYRLMVEDQGPVADGLKKLKAHDEKKGAGSKPFGSLTEKEIQEVRETIDHLVRKLKDIVTRRWASTSSGVIDVKKTLRAAQKYHGVPIEIRMRHKPKRKARIVTLCDVSSSVWASARFMLNVLYSLQECFADVKSFIFVAGLADVTKTLKEHEINHAIDLVLKESPLEFNQPTDYGRTLIEFKDKHMDTLDKKTTLIVMGDARTNYQNPRDDIFEEMRERARRVIWLNPEPHYVWNTGDSEMSTYEPYCNELRQVRTLNELMEFVEELVL
ncbi:MAG TPA: VWA domain-containing protein [Desulfomonilia bacterium]